jgi:ABC-2 type transport system ATP-binding protein
MFHKPPLLILDEPTGGLDPLVQEEFLDIVAETREEGRTVFFSSHILSEVERVCDRVAIIREGELVAVEDTKDLTNKAFRHVRITFGKPLDVADARSFEKLPGVENFIAEGPKTSFTMSESSDEVVKLAARHTVADIEVERPSLEEIFLTYYGDDDNGEENKDRNGGSS